jgi:hypothetical protein
LRWSSVGKRIWAVFFKYCPRMLLSAKNIEFYYFFQNRSPPWIFDRIFSAPLTSPLLTCDMSLEHLRITYGRKISHFPSCYVTGALLRSSNIFFFLQNIFTPESLVNRPFWIHLWTFYPRIYFSFRVRVKLRFHLNFYDL